MRPLRRHSPSNSAALWRRSARRSVATHAGMPPGRSASRSTRWREKSSHEPPRQAHFRTSHPACPVPASTPTWRQRSCLVAHERYDDGGVAGGSTRSPNDPGERFLRRTKDASPLRIGSETKYLAAPSRPTSAVGDSADTMRAALLRPLRLASTRLARISLIPLNQIQLWRWFNKICRRLIVLGRSWRHGCGAIQEAAPKCTENGG